MKKNILYNDAIGQYLPLSKRQAVFVREMLRGCKLGELKRRLMRRLRCDEEAVNHEMLRFIFTLKRSFFIY